MSGRHLWYHEFFFQKQKFLFCDISLKTLLNSVFKKKWIKVIKSDRISKCTMGLYSTNGKLILTARRWRSIQNKTVKWSFIYFFYHSSCRKDQFTVLNWKFGTQDFTDPDLLKIQRTLTGLLLWFCLHKCFLNKINKTKKYILKQIFTIFRFENISSSGAKRKMKIELKARYN